MWDLTLMQSDLDRLTSRLVLVGDWSWVKWTFIALAVLTAAGVAVRRRSIPLHVTLMLASMSGLVLLFLYGVQTRGVFGSVPGSRHSIVFYVPLLTHILAGAVYMLVGLVALATGRAARRRAERLNAHRRRGKIAVVALYVNVLFALPL